MFCLTFDGIFMTDLIESGVKYKVLDLNDFRGEIVSGNKLIYACDKLGINNFTNIVNCIAGDKKYGISDKNNFIEYCKRYSNSDILEFTDSSFGCSILFKQYGTSLTFVFGETGRVIYINNKVCITLKSDYDYEADDEDEYNTIDIFMSGIYRFDNDIFKISFTISDAFSDPIYLYFYVDSVTGDIIYANILTYDFKLHDLSNNKKVYCEYLWFYTTDFIVKSSKVKGIVSDIAKQITLSKGVFI